MALLLSLFILALAMARPSVDGREPLERATVMLALDVSLSMKSDDVAPTRIEAAQAAAKEFVDQLPAQFNVGLVAFAKAANVVVSPTKDHDAVVSAIDGLQLAEATATGEAVFTCLDAIAGVPADGADGPPPARIVLLSDGYRTYGRSIEDAAAAATGANVPVSTIAFGTDEGSVDINGSRAAGAGGPAGARAAGRVDPGLLLRGGLGGGAQAGVRGHGQLDRLQDRGQGDRTRGSSGSACCSPSPRPA